MQPLSSPLTLALALGLNPTLHLHVHPGFPGSAGSPATDRSTGANQYTFELWGHAGQLFNAGANFDVRARPTQLTTRTIDVTGGQSGGPCFAVINGVHTVVGTVRGSFNGANLRWNDCVAYTSDKIGDLIAATDGQLGA